MPTSLETHWLRYSLPGPATDTISTSWSTKLAVCTCWTATVPSGACTMIVSLTSSRPALAVIRRSTLKIAPVPWIFIADDDTRDICTVPFHPPAVAPVSPKALCCENDENVDVTKARRPATITDNAPVLELTEKLNGLGWRSTLRLW